MYLKKINLKNKTALVTGAGKGIGMACSIALAEAGADLIIVSRTQKDLDKVAKIIRKFKVGLGFNPKSHKSKQGDGRTPEGLYFIDRKNYNSKYFLSLGISYPNTEDKKYAKSLDIDPGGDIFIHGGPRYKGEFGKRDWTAGCISVSDKNMKVIYSMVKAGTPILINP